MADGNGGKGAYKTIVVNMFGGPGAGKTTAAHQVAAELSKAGYLVEYAPEFAKQVAWARNNEANDLESRVLAANTLNGLPANQHYIWMHQKREVEQYLGMCDFVVTDSPTLLSCLYVKDDLSKVKSYDGDLENPTCETDVDPQTARRYKDEVEGMKREWLEDFRSRENFNMFVERGGRYEARGRVHTEEEALEIDAATKAYLNGNGIYYGTYDHDHIDVAVRNMIATRERVIGSRENPGNGRKDEAMAEENKAMEESQERTGRQYVTMPNKGYKGQNLFEQKSGKNGPFWSVKIPPHFPEVETVDGKTVDISNATFTVSSGDMRITKNDAGMVAVTEGDVTQYENDPSYRSVAFPVANKDGQSWAVNVRKYVKDGEDQHFKIDVASQLAPAAQVFRAERADYARAQAMKENQPPVPTKAKARETPRESEKRARKISEELAKSAPEEKKVLSK